MSKIINVKKPLFNAFKFLFLIIFLHITFTVITAEVIILKYEKANKKNPFIPIVTNDGQLINIQEDDEDSSLVLEGIIYDKDGNSMAVINGQIVKKNDSIGNAKIVEIRKDSVIYIKDGEIFILNSSRKENH